MLSKPKRFVLPVKPNGCLDMFFTVDGSDRLRLVGVIYTACRDRSHNCTGVLHRNDLRDLYDLCMFDICPWMRSVHTIRIISPQWSTAYSNGPHTLTLRFILHRST